MPISDPKKKALYKKLGLLYEQDYVGSSTLIAEPIGQLDEQAFIDRQTRCWKAPGQTKIENKKTLILSSWCFKHLHSRSLETMQHFLNELLEDGFAIYITGKDNQLTRITNEEALVFNTNDFNPVSTAMARAQAAKHRLAKKTTDIVDTQRLTELLNHLKEQRDFWTGSAFQNDYQKLPGIDSLDRIENVEHALEPGDKFRYEARSEKDLKLLTPQLKRHIYSLKMDTEGAQAVSSFSPSLTHLHLSKQTLTASTLNEIINTHSALKALAMTDCTVQDDDLLHIKPGQLQHLTELVITNSSMTEKQFDAILAAAPNLEILDISSCPQLGHTGSSVQLKHLKKLKANKSAITIERLNTMIPESNKLSSIDISDCEHLGNVRPKFGPGQLKYLIEFDAYNSSIRGDQLGAFLSAAPNIEKILLYGCQSIHETKLELTTELNHVRVLTISNASITAAQLSTTLSKMPHLEHLHLFYYHNIDGHNLKPGQLPDLRRLTILDTTLSAATFDALLTAAQNVEQIDFKNKTNPDVILQKAIARKLGCLKKLSFTECQIEPTMFLNILASFPNLESISLSGSQRLKTALLTLKPHQLSKLERFAISSDHTFAAEHLAALLQAAPHLQELTLTYCALIQNRTLKLDAEKIKLLMGLPPQQLSLTLNQMAAEQEAQRVQESQKRAQQAPSIEKLDIPIPIKNKNKASRDTYEKYKMIEGDLLSHPERSLHGQQIFKGHQGDPLPNFFHLQSYDWDINCSLKKHVPTLEELTKAPIYSTLKQTRSFFEENPTENSFYGQVNLGPLEAGKWYQIPALTTEDTLLRFAADMKHYKIMRDKTSGYYYLSVSEAVSESLINYIIESPIDSVKASLEIASPLKLQHLIQQLAFNKQSKLIQNEAYLQLITYPKEELIQELADFCRFPNDSADNVDLPSAELLNHLIRIRAGACRHRVMLFAGLCSELGITSSVVINDFHAFVTVLDKTQQRLWLDLGGGSPNIQIASMEDLPDSLQEEEKPIILPQAIQLEPDNPFQTWNSLPLQATDMPSLAKELTAQERTIPRQLVIMPDSTAIEALHKAVLAEGADCFFTPNLDAMSLKALKANGELGEAVDSALAVFLKYAQAHPERQMTWFINWSNPEAEHVAKNSIIDDLNRRLGDIQLPPNLHIVCAMDTASAAKMGKDYYSRFDAVSQVPASIPYQSMRDEFAPNEDEGHIAPSKKVPLATEDDWKTELLGAYAFNGNNSEFIPGALLTNPKGQSTVLQIQNAPWDNPEFRWFMTELLSARRFFANGTWHQLPPEVKIEFANPEFNYSALPKPETKAPSGFRGWLSRLLSFLTKSKPLHEHILNPTTYPYFFSHYYVDPELGIQSTPGLLKPKESVRLVVTENLSEAQWYKVWVEAEKKQNKIEIQCAPDVFVPTALQPWIVKTSALEPKPPVSLIVSNDVDAAAKPYSDMVHIPIDLKTRFETLFSHIDRKGEGFTSKDTMLLEAIRAGKPIVLKGQFSDAMAQRLQTLFTNKPSLYVNGKTIAIKSPIILITDNEASFTNVKHQTITYDPEVDFAKVDEPIAVQLKALYTTLNITPCHSHFSDLPSDKTLHSDWFKTKKGQLNASAGILEYPEDATTPEELLTYLDTHPFAFLLSKTGAGKTYFVDTVLPQYAKSIGREITIYHGIDHIKEWAQHGGYLFPDEANRSDESYNILDNLAQGKQEIWIEGQRYPLSPESRVVFTGNPKQYEGRIESDLLRRFPYYLAFKGQDLSKIIGPLLKQLDDKDGKLLEMIEEYYEKALNADLNITPRNAQMICLAAFALKSLVPTRDMPIEFLMKYAILREIESLAAESKLTQPLQQSINEQPKYKATIQDTLAAQLPPLKSEEYIWTNSRKNAAVAIQTLLTIRNLKIEGKFEQAAGLNGVVIEGEPGLGKSQLLISLLKAQNIPYMTIDTGDVGTMRRQLIQAYKEGRVAIMDELNSFPDEPFLNAILSGTYVDENDKTPPKPGFSLLATQNPATTYDSRETLSYALLNRLIFLNLKEYKPEEFIQIIEKKYGLSVNATKLTEQYTRARQYAEQEKLFPPPNPRTLFRQAQEEAKKQKDMPSYKEALTKMKKSDDTPSTPKHGK